MSPRYLGNGSDRPTAIELHWRIAGEVQRGVSLESIADTRNVSPKAIKRLGRLLNGISSEAVELLKDKNVAIDGFWLLRKMSLSRQNDAAELMVAMNNYALGFITCLYVATPRDQLADSESQKSIVGISDNQMKKVELNLPIRLSPTPTICSVSPWTAGKGRRRRIEEAIRLILDCSENRTGV